MRNPPPEVTAAWPKPNYVNPEHRGNELLAAGAAVLGVALFCLALRLYVRIAIVYKSGLDDWHMVVAALFGAGVTVCTILMAKQYGWERHVWDLTPDQIANGRKVSMAGQSLFFLATCFAKLSILLSYARIAPEHSLFRRFTWGSMALVVAIAAVSLFALWFQCRPISTYWDLSEPTPVCLSEGRLMFSLAVANVATDLLLAVLPMPTLARLNLPLRQRIATIALFSLGLVVISAGVARAYWIYDVVVLDVADFTWQSYNVWIWTALECNLAVICGSIPVLRPLFFFIISGGKSDTSGGIGDRDLGIRLRRQQQQQQQQHGQHAGGLDFCDYGMGGTARTTLIVAEPPRTASSASVKTGRSYRVFLEDDERRDAAALGEFLGRAGRRWRHTVGLGRRDAPPRALLGRPVGADAQADGGLELDAGAPRRHTTGGIRTGLPRVTTDITVVHSGKPG
ncbi:hypothetical protein RB595_005971 [Gaeumannomyces hyphopodioides]